MLRTRGPLRPNFEYSAFRSVPCDYPVAWSNRGENAEVVLTPESFRPNVPWMSDQDDYVILLRDPHASSVKISWILTEDGNDAVLDDVALDDVLTLEVGVFEVNVRLARPMI